MARLYVFAEGPTEQTFASIVLSPHLADHGVYMRNPVLIAHAHKRQRTHRGGGRNFHAMQKDIVRFLRQDASRDAFFTTMINLYALHRGFPGTEAAQVHRGDPYRRTLSVHRLIVPRVRRQVSRPRGRVSPWLDLRGLARSPAKVDTPVATFRSLGRWSIAAVDPG